MLAQRAIADSPRWTHAVEDQSAPIPEEMTSELRESIRGGISSTVACTVPELSVRLLNMPLPPMPFFMDGLCEDLGYLNTRDHPCGAEHKHFVEELWGRYYSLADTHFREDARNHFLQRFWEMYLAVALLEHGFELHRHGDEGPEFYAPLGSRRVWFEAIAPDPGTGLDQVPQLISGECTEIPTEKILLRFTNALDEKRRKHAAALAKGIVSAEDHYVLAINSR